MFDPDDVSVVIERPAGRVVHPLPVDYEARLRVIERLCRVVPAEGSVWHVEGTQRRQRSYAKVPDQASGETTT